MAKVEGPLFSLRARGSIENLLTFQTTKAGQICKGYRAPRDPKSKLQLQNRDNFKKARDYYRQLKKEDRQAWKEMTYDQNYTGYAGFIKDCKLALDTGLEWVNMKEVQVIDLSREYAVIKTSIKEPLGIKALYGYSPGHLQFEQIEEEPYSTEPELLLCNLLMATTYFFRLKMISSEDYAGETGIYKINTLEE